MELEFLERPSANGAPINERSDDDRDIDDRYTDDRHHGRRRARSQRDGTDFDGETEQDDPTDEVQ